MTSKDALGVSLLGLASSLLLTDRLKKSCWYVCENRLESEKTELISELNKLHKEKEVWALQRSELEMTQAELSAENTQLRSELNSKVLLLLYSVIPAWSGCCDEQSV